MMYLDMWRSSTFLLYSCKVAFWIQETSPRLSVMSSAQSFYGPCLQLVAHSLTFCFSGNVPLPHSPGTSYHVTQFYKAITTSGCQLSLLINCTCKVASLFPRWAVHVHVKCMQTLLCKVIRILIGSYPSVLYTSQPMSYLNLLWSQRFEKAKAIG